MPDHTAEQEQVGRTTIVPTDQDYDDAKEVIASLIREKVAAGLRAPTNQSIHQAYGLVIEALYVEWAESEVLRDWAFAQLNRIINAVRGEPEPLHQHSLHDVAERVEQAMADRGMEPCADFGSHPRGGHEQAERNAVIRPGLGRAEEPDS